MPPVLTKSWFHTGVYVAGGRISRQLAHEYFRGELPDESGRSDAGLLDDTAIPGGLTAFEAREACRALKGSLLRQEVYALDGTPREHIPYTVTESNFTVAPLQPKGCNRHAVFFIHAREAVQVHYERRADDPRVRHDLTLAVDGYGNVLRSAAIGYQRARPEHDEQGLTLATLTENAFTNAVLDADAYRAPLVAEAKTYQLTAGRLCSAEILSLALVDALAKAAREIDYEIVPTPGETQKRLIEHTRTLYRRNDLSAPLPPGGLESLGAPGRTYKQAFTRGLLNVLEAKASPADLDPILTGPRRSAIATSDGEGPLWIPSGPGVSSRRNRRRTPATELALAAQAYFFLARCVQDPFGHSTHGGL